MRAKRIIKKRKGFGVLNLLAAMFISVAAMLFLVSFANNAIATERMSTLKGEVIAIDTYDNLLIVRPSDASLASTLGEAGDVTFSLNNMTDISSCTQSKTAEDLVIGEKVTVRYHQGEGKLFADAVTAEPVILACYQ